jgi:hypothetical protein
LLAIALTAAAATRAGEPGATAPYLADRGDGIPTSLFGTYIREKEFIFYPFFEYSRYKKFEYAPKDFGLRGLGEDDEFFGQAFEREALIFMAYAFTDSLALEFESALYSTIDFRKSPNDSSAVPGRLRESGLGDTEINIRYRYLKETATRPEVTFFFKTAFPLQKRKKLLGTQHWEFSPGVVLTKGFSWGTVALRASMAADSDERKLEFSEYAIDYIKRLSDNWRIVLSLEGEQDEASVIGELQYRLGKNAVLKINSGFGLTKKAANFAPEIGILFRF